MDILVAQDTVPRISFLRNTLFLLLVCFSAFTSAVTVNANTEGCGGSYSGTYGNFTSPGYPSRYADNLRCKWTIKVSQNSRIHIDFIYIEIETGDGCLYDYLLFRDGLEPTSPALAKICHAHTTTIKSTGSEMTVLFVTDSSTGFRGFHLVWKAVPKMPLLQPEGISITSPWMGIATPKSLRQIDSGITDHLWAVDKTSTVYLYANGIWDAVEGKMAYVTAGPVVIGTSEDGYVWYRKGITPALPKGNAWERVPILTRMQRVETGRNGVAVGLDLLGNLHQLQISGNRPTGLAWKILDGDKNDPLIDVSCGSYACWFTTLKGVLYLSRDIGFDEQADSSPERVGSPFAAKQVAAGFDGSLWAITSTGDAYKRIGVSMIKPEGTSWQKLEKVAFEQITVGLMGVYGLTKSGIIITMEEHKCGGILTAKKGMFASPDYPNVYPANITCLWIIRVPDAEGILVQFMKLVAIGRTSVCRDDYLVSYEDGKYSSKSEPVIECGDKVEDKYFTGNEVWIEFKSGTTNRGFGFQAVYDAWFDSAITSQGPLKESTTMTTPATRRKQTETTARTRSTQLGTQASSQANTQTYGRTSDATTKPRLMLTEVVKSEKSMTTKNNEFSVATKVPSTQGKTNTKGSDLKPPSTQRLIEISTKATSHTQRVSTAPSTRMPESTDRMPSASILSTQDVGTTHAVSTNPQLKSEQPTKPVDLSTAPSSAAPLVPRSSSGTKTLNKMVPSVDPKSTQMTPETTKSSSQTEAPSISSGTKTMNKMVPSVNPESPQVTRETMKSSSQTEVPSFSTQGYVQPPTVSSRGSSKQPPLPTESSTAPSLSPELTIPAGWQLIPSTEKMSQVAVNIFDVVWAVNENGYAFALVADSWKPVGRERFRSLAVGQELAWGIKEDGSLIVRLNLTEGNPEGTSWVNLDGKDIVKIIVYGKDEIFAQTIEGGLMRRIGISEEIPYGSIWTDTGKTVLDASAGSFGLFYLDSKNSLHFSRRERDTDSIFPFTDDVTIGGALKTVVAGHGSSLWAIESDGALLRRDKVEGLLPFGEFWKPMEGRTMSVSPSILFVYRVLADGRVVKKQDNYCGGVLTSKVGRIQTPNYPANYSANTNCLWTIEVKDAVKVHLEVEDFEIEPEADCISDRLVIYAPRSFPLYNCGKALKTKTVDGDFFMVEFLSNDKINTKGFSIIYRADFSSEQVEKPTEVPFVCDTKCETNYEPVCGSDGKTYANECVLRTESCLAKKVIKIVKSGKCDTVGIACDVVCGIEYEPLCGSDSKTYANECVMRAESCIMRQTVSLAYKGQCKEEVSSSKSPESTPSTYGPTTVPSTRPTESPSPEPVPTTPDQRPLTIPQESVPSARTEMYGDWEHVSSTPKMKMVSANNNDTLWALDFTGIPFLLTNTRWKYMGPERFMSLSVDEWGVWGIRIDGTLRYRQGVSHTHPEGLTWVTVDGNGIKKVVTGPMGSILAIDGNQKLLARSGITSYLPIGTSWEDTGKRARDVSFSNYGVWIINDFGKLQFADLNIGDDANYVALRWRNVNTGVKSISAGHGGSLWGILVNGTVVQRQDVNSSSPVGTKWKVLGGHATSVSPGHLNVYRTLSNGVVVKKQDNKCGGVLSSMKGIFKTPNYPMMYPKNTNCLWLVRVSGGKGIKVEFDDFELQESTFCSADYVRTIVPGTQIFPRECGKISTTKYIRSTTAMIEFVSDKTIETKGFIAKYTTLFMMNIEVTPAARTTAPIVTTESKSSIPEIQKIDLSDRKCGGLLEETSGIFASPNYPNPYPNEVVCLWVFNVPQAKSLIVTLESFDVGQSSGDFLAYSRGGINPTNEKPVIITRKSKKQFTFDGDSALFEFVSDGQQTSKGFFARYDSDLKGNIQVSTEKPTTQPTTTAHSGCGGLLFQDSGTVTSPGYPKNYDSNLSCTWVIRSRSGKKISLTFSEVVVEYDSTCKFDVIKVGDGSRVDENTRDRFCGNKYQLNFVSQGEYFWIHFSSDTNSEWRGFKASWSVVVETTTMATTLQMTTTKQTAPKRWGLLPLGDRQINQIEAGMSDKIVAVDSSDVPYIYINRIWIPILQQEVSYISSGDAGIWAISKDGRALFRAGVRPSYPSGTKWEVVGSDVFVRIDSGPEGYVFAVRSNGIAAYRDGVSKQLPFGTRWVNIGGKFKSLSVGTYGLWAIDEYGNVMYAQRPSKLGRFPISWITLPGLLLTEIDSGYGNNVWGLAKSGSVYRRAGVAQDSPYGRFWQLENLRLNDVTIGLPGIFGIDINKKILQRQDTTQICGEIITSRSGRIFSPGYPFTSYPIYSHCLWIIRVPEAARITLTVASFDVHQSVDCVEDYLFLYKRGYYSPEYGGNKFCGSYINNTFTYNGNEVWLQFNAGIRPGASKPRGFDIRYTSEAGQATIKPSTTVSTSTAPNSTPLQISTVPYSGCGGRFTSNYGSLTSPDFPNQYSTNHRCIWTIELDPSREIVLKFDTFDVEEDYACRFDFLLVKAPGNLGRELGKFCGNRLPANIEVGGNKVWILFKSDDTLNERGFRVTWASKQKSGVIGKPTTRASTTQMKREVTTKQTNPKPFTAPQIPADWSKVPTDINIVHIDGGISPRAWAIDEQGRAYMEDGNNWRLIGLDQMKWVTSGESGVWAVDRLGRIFLRRGVAPLAPQGAFWDKVDGPAMEKIDSGPVGSLLALDDFGNLYLRQGLTPENPKGSNWKQVGSGYKHMSVGSYGYWAIDPQNRVFFAPLSRPGQITENLRWIPISQKFVQVKAGFGGSLWGITPDGDVYQRKGVTAIIPSGVSWEKEGNLKANGITAGMSGVFASVQGTNEIVKKSGHECGAILTSPSGVFSTPNYPSNYPANTVCLWQIRIPEARRVVIEFLDFRLDAPSSNCNKDFLLYLRDGEFPSAYGAKKRCGYDKTPISFEGNKAWVEFISDGSNNFPGFSARYAALIDPGRLTEKPVTPSLPASRMSTTNQPDVYTGCGGLIDATSRSSGQFAHPGYPGNYEDSQSCEYIIRTGRNRKLVLDFDLFDLEITSDCRYDYIEIRDGELPSDKLIGKYCGKHDVKGIRSTGSSLNIRFRSDQTSNFQGYRARWRVEYLFTTTQKPETTTGNNLEGPSIAEINKACSGTVDASFKSVGYLAHPSYPDKYKNNLICRYRIKAKPNDKIRLTFRKFSLEAHETCRFDFIEVRDGDSNQARSLGKFCGSPNPKDILSSGNSLFITFLTDYATDDAGFLIKWNVEKEDTLPTLKPSISTTKKDRSPITDCGGVFRSSDGLFATPNYPSDYSSNLDCTWSIIVDEKKVVQLTFEFFDIEKSSGACLYDYVEIFDADRRRDSYVSLGKYCDRMPKEILSSGNELRVLFHSDNARNRKGFVARWMAEGVVMQTTPSARTTEKPCFQRLSGFGGEISRGSLSSFYSPNQDCIWVITVRNSYKIKVEFDFFEVEASRSCSKDFFKIHDGSTSLSPTLMNICGNSKPEPIISSGNELLLRFKADANNNARGFKLRWSETQATTTRPVITPSTASVNSYGICHSSRYLFGRSGELTSPNYPLSYPAGDLQCTKIIDVPSNTRLVVTFEDFAIGASAGCVNNAVIFRTDSTVKTYCTDTIPPTFSTTDRYLRIDFSNTDNPRPRGFKLKWNIMAIEGPTQRPVYPEAPKCGGRLYGSSGVLESPKFSQKYPFPITCTWILEVGPLSEIEIRPVSANFYGSQCSSSHLLFRDGISSNSRPLKRLCEEENMLPFKSERSTLYIELKIDENKEVDFKINWKEKSVQSLKEFKCGGMRTQPMGMIKSPEYPSQYQSNLVCTWVILAPKGQRISLDIMAFELEQDARCSKDYLAIRNGQTSNGAIVGRYCGRNIPRTIMSRGNSIWLQLQTDCKNTNNGFKLNWKFISSSTKTSEPQRTPTPSTEAPKTRETSTRLMPSSTPNPAQQTSTPGSTVNAQGGLIAGRRGVIQSPNYPRTYPNNMDIVWVIKGPAPGRIALTFKSFALEEDSACRYDYVHLRDGPASDSPSIGKFCGNNIPATYTSADNALWVKFLSDGTENRLGFEAEWNWLPSEALLPSRGTETVPRSACGGVLIYEDGEFSTPNYPSRYSSNTECIWVIKPKSPANAIELRFKSFSLEPESRCGYDFLEVKEGDSRSSPSLGRFCGASFPRTLVSRRGAFWIRFKSDSSTNDQGFLASWTTNRNQRRRRRGARLIMKKRNSQ